MSRLKKALLRVYDMLGAVQGNNLKFMSVSQDLNLGMGHTNYKHAAADVTKISFLAKL